MKDINQSASADKCCPICSTPLLQVPLLGESEGGVKAGIMLEDIGFENETEWVICDWCGATFMRKASPHPRAWPPGISPEKKAI